MGGRGRTLSMDQRSGSDPTQPGKRIGDALPAMSPTGFTRR
jgi:hypothetical protein